MSLSLTRMRALVRKGLGNLDSNDLPNPEVDELLNLALWAVSDKYPFKEKECLVTASTVAGQEAYAVPDELDAIRAVGAITADGGYRQLHRMTPAWYARHAALDSEDSWAFPERWMRRDASLILDPIPDDVYTIRVEMWRTINSLLEGTVDTVDLPRNWHEMVVEGAITRGHYYRQDYNLAQQADNFRVSHEKEAVLVKAKENQATHHGGLDVLWSADGLGEDPDNGKI